MPFLLLLVLTLTCFQSHWPEPPFELGALGCLLTWVGVAGFAAVSGGTTRRLSRALHSDMSQRSAIVRRFAHFRRYFAYGLIAFHVLALYLFGWGSAVGDVMPGRELALLSPLLAALLVAWGQFHPLEKALHDAAMNPVDPPFPGRLAYVALQARHNFLLVLPPLLLVLVEETTLALFPGLQQEQGVMSVLAGLLVVSAFIGFPLLLRVILGLKRLPDSPLRERLLATARRLNLRFTDILLWNTRGTIANAMVTGTVPFLRYVVLTDRLIQDLDADEVEAVFGHEVGHVKHHHMFFYLGFLLMSLLALGVAWQETTQAIARTEFAKTCQANLPTWLVGSERGSEGVKTAGLVTNMTMVMLFALYVFVVFGFLSRRCERQADVYGCRTASIPVFIEALEKVARINGIHRENPGWLSSWQHSTIARRVDFLQRLHNDPTQEQRFQRRVRTLKLATLMVLIAVLGSLCYLAGADNVWAFMQSQQASSETRSQRTSPAN